MAQSIGAKIRSGFVGILVGLLVLAFAVWGVNDIFVPGVRNAVVSVGDESVSTRDFQRDLQSRLREIAVQRGEGLTNEQAYQQGIHRELIGQYQLRLAIEKDADDLGIGVNRQDAKQYIESFPAFKSSVTGEFDRDKLVQAIGGLNNGYSIKAFEEDTLRDLRREQTTEAIVGGIQAPSGFATRYFDYVSEQRKATILTLNKGAVPAPDAPDDETLQAYIDGNAVRYTAPEYRKVTMIRLEPQYFLPDLEVTEDEVRAEFDRRVARGDLGTQATRDVIILAASDETTAQQAADRLMAGEAPELVAGALGLVAPDSYDDIEKDTLIDSATDEIAFNLEEGQAAAGLNSLGGWEAIYVPEVTPGTSPVFASLEREIRQEIGLDKAKEKIFDLQDLIDPMTFENRTLEEIAEELDLPMESYDFIDRSGSTQDGLRLAGSTNIPGIAADDTLLREIFTADIGLDSQIFETVHEGAVLFRVVDIIDSQVRPLEDVRDSVIAAWTSEQIQDALNERGIALAGEIGEGRTLEDLSEELGTAATLEERGISRANPPRDIDGQIVVDLLTGAPGEISRGAGVQPETYTIARLDTITPNSDGLAGEILDVVQRNISSEISLDIQNAYRLAILKEHELREYPDQVTTVMGIEGQ